jgi:hypothetical protein
LILDQYGRPIRALREAAPVQLRGGQLAAQLGMELNPGWRDGAPGDTSTGTGYGRYGLTRAHARQTCRTLYFTNGLFKAAVDISASFLVGDALRYGTLADPGLQSIVDDFWGHNSFSELVSQRLVKEWFLDGEIGAVFPTAQDDSPPSPDQPARIGMLDVDLSGFDLEASTTRGAMPGDMVSALTLNRGGQILRRWDEGQFAWAANDALWNDPRGWPIAYPAAEGAVAYIAMLNMRLNVHHVQQRVLAVYKAFLDPNGQDPNGVADGGLYDWRRKTSAFRSLPDRGGVLPVIVQPGYTDATGKQVQGVEEDIKFLQPAQGAADAASDMRLILRLVGLCMGGLPEHYLGEGGNATRTTAASMGTPAVRLANSRQAALSALLTRIFRVEIKRRGGGDRQYRYQKGSRKKLPIDRIELPWVFPAIREETLEQIVRRVEVALKNGLISQQTATDDLGYDSALEVDRLAGQAPKPLAGGAGETP